MTALSKKGKFSPLLGERPHLRAAHIPRSSRYQNLPGIGTISPQQRIDCRAVITASAPPLDDAGCQGGMASPLVAQGENPFGIVIAVVANVDAGPVVLKVQFGYQAFVQGKTETCLGLEQVGIRDGENPADLA